ncbi:MAG: Holliday junction branch migration protein RuvA [Polyangiaceae bacterium]
MIGRLTGKIVAQEDDSIIVVDVQGVGYELLAPLGTAGRSTVDGEGRATFFVHTHAREDALILFGFATALDRVAFRTLIGVSSVGPKTAIGILSALPANELARAISEKDVAKLSSISGIGKKTAERLLLELRDKLPTFPTDGVAPATPTKRGGASGEMLLSALTKLGYKPAEAERAIASLGPRLDAVPFAELLREALAVLAK